MSAEAESLQITLEHEGPIPLADFTDALHRFDARYARFARARKSPTEDQHLSITRISEGSVVIDLVVATAVAQSVIAGAGSLNTLVDFGKNIATLLTAFRSPATSSSDVSIADCDDARAIVKPVLNSEGGGITLAVNGDHNIVQPVLIQIDQAEARVIDNRAALIRNALASPDEETRREVLFVWKQIQDAPGKEVGQRSPDRGIIQSIDGVARAVTFADKAIKEEMYRGDINPFEMGYIVDVKVLISPAGIAGYRILAVHDTIPLDTE
nr:hypothetical protein [Brevundimonas diminuta]